MLRDSAENIFKHQALAAACAEVTRPYLSEQKWEDPLPHESEVLTTEVDAGDIWSRVRAHGEAG